VAVLGFAFKKNTGDTRETPALDVIRGLVEEGAAVSIYDPVVSEEQMHSDLSNIPDKKVATHSNAYSACKGAHTIVICTEWDEFKELDYCAIYHAMEKPANVFDARIILDAGMLEAIGFQVYTVGCKT